MEKLKMKSQDLSQEHIAEIKELFPDAVTEVKGNGIIKLKVDFDVLRQELSDSLIDDKQERYQMTWPGKKESVLISNAPTRFTLRPEINKSKDFKNTKNIYIEGDNIESLKALRETYLNSIKMIYIDPPYNTGNDGFVYNDKRYLSNEEFAKKSGVVDDCDNKLFDIIQNNENNGKYHSDWLSMMFSTMRLAKDFLKDSGFLFISIDDHEEANLVKICDEIFGETNRLAILIWKKKYTGGKGSNTFADYHEYILAYCKDITKIGDIAMARPDEEKGKFIFRDEYFNERGAYYTRPLKSNLDPRPTLVYPITLPNGESVETQWICANDTFLKLKEEGRIEFKDPKTSKYPVYKKFYENDDDGKTKIPSFIEISNNNAAKEELKKLFGIYQTRDLPFQTPKPVDLLKLFVVNFTSGDDIIMDFFSGSGSTAQAVYQANADDGFNRRYILIEIGDKLLNCKDYQTTCDFAEKRISLAGKQIQQSNPLIADALDVGFRVFKLDSSNMKDLFYLVSDIKQSLLGEFESNIKEDRTQIDLVFQIMLELGIPLSSSIEEKEIENKKIFFVGGNNLVACFEERIDDTIIKELAKVKPLYACFRDSSFENDSASVNCEQIFKTLSSATRIKVL